MKTRTSILMTAAATLLCAGLVGCQSWKSPSASTTSDKPPGPATGAALLSSKKTFDIVGRTSKNTTEATPPDPSANITTLTARSELESRGYQYQSNSPDFLVSIAWNEYQQADPPTPTNPQPGLPANAPNIVSKGKLAVVARDAVSGVILWQSPMSDPLDPKTVTDDQARALTKRALADFPPAQPGK